MVNKVAHRINPPTIEIKLIVMLWVLRYVMVQMPFNPVERKLCELKYLHWLIIDQLMTSPYKVSTFVHDVSVLIYQIAFGVGPAPLQITYGLLVLFGTISQYYLLGTLISLELPDDAFDFVLLAFKIV